jgi:6-pyruvoyltetrahydropterin/6-carboxytetrahydropterin synthase
MAARYTMKIVTDFAAAHWLRNYDGPCNRLHGHNWKVEVLVNAQDLDGIGMGLDFADIKTATKDVIGALDHRNLNDIPPFDQQNPTAENISAFLYQQLSQRLNTARVKVAAVTLWETERACVTYQEDSP